MRREMDGEQKREFGIGDGRKKACTLRQVRACRQTRITMISAGERPGDTIMTHRATRGNAGVSSASNVPRQYGAACSRNRHCCISLDLASILARIIDRTASAWRSCRRRSQDTMPQSRESERSARNESIAVRSTFLPRPSRPTPRRPCK